jgi:hypothetical protein
MPFIYATLNFFTFFFLQKHTAILRIIENKTIKCCRKTALFMGK